MHSKIPDIHSHLLKLDKCLPRTKCTDFVFTQKEVYKFLVKEEILYRKQHSGKGNKSGYGIFAICEGIKDFTKKKSAKRPSDIPPIIDSINDYLSNYDEIYFAMLEKRNSTRIRVLIDPEEIKAYKESPEQIRSKKKDTETISIAGKEKKATPIGLKLIHQYKQRLLEKFEQFFPLVTNTPIDNYHTLFAKEINATNDEAKDVFHLSHTNKRLIFLGESGCGKSATLKKLVLECSRKKDDLIPIYIQLGDIPPGENGLNRWIDNNYFGRLLSEMSYEQLNKQPDIKQKLIFLLDGYDEIKMSSAEERNVKCQIFGLLRRFHESRFIISCRNHLYKDLQKFAFKIFEFIPLNFDENDLKNNPYTNELTNAKQKKFKNLIKYNSQLKNLLENPYYLYLICHIIKSTKNKHPKSPGEIFETFFNQQKRELDNPKILKKYYSLLQHLCEEIAYYSIENTDIFIAEKPLVQLINNIFNKSEYRNTPLSSQEIIDKILLASNYVIASTTGKSRYKLKHTLWTYYFYASKISKYDKQNLLRWFDSSILFNNKENSPRKEIIYMLVGLTSKKHSDLIFNILMKKDFLTACSSLKKAIHFNKKIQASILRKIEHDLFPRNRIEAHQLARKKVEHEILCLNSIKTEEALNLMLRLLSKSWHRKLKHLVISLIFMVSRTNSPKAYSALKNLLYISSDPYILREIIQGLCHLDLNKTLEYFFDSLTRNDYLKYESLLYPIIIENYYKLTLKFFNRRTGKNSTRVDDFRNWISVSYNAT